jgi:acyl-CoA dehydrogenase
VAVLRLVGRHAAPVPLAETDLLAGWALSASGLPVPGGPLTAAPMRPDEGVVFRRVGAGWAISGRARRVPAARYAARLVVVGRTEGGGTMVAAVDPGCCEISRGENLAGETRDDVTLDGVRVAGDEVAPAGSGVDEERLRLRGALTRSVLMAGALDRVLELSVSRAGERHQFGRPIGRFQAVQQQLATLAGEVAAAGAAADAAVAAAELGDAIFEVAAAKIRTGQAAGKAAAMPTRFTALSASPRGTRCTKAPGGSGPGGTSSVRRASGLSASGALSAGAAPRTFGRSSQPRRRRSGSRPLRHGATRRGA